MLGIGQIAVSCGIVAAMTLLARRLCTLTHTTLRSTRKWVVLVVVIWTIAWSADSCGHILSPEQADHLWYATAVLALCPPIAVLGARRPGTRFWTWFILLPMLLVLGWPVLTIWLQGSELRRLQLETPQCAAFCLVLVMGLGNYCGTRYTPTALLYGLSVILPVWSLSVVSPVWLSDQSSVRFWSTGLMVVAIWLVRTAARPACESRFDQLWFDFFDTFGIVWGRRIQDRVNHLARSERLPVRLELDGFEWTNADHARLGEAAMAEDGQSKSIAEEARVEHIMRWLLRRFVDPAWIDQRLGTKPANEIARLVVDS